MGGAAVESGGGKKKSLDFELNLVPFIDLLSCLISFLLITATWNQLVRIQTSQKTNAGRPQQPKQDDKVMIAVVPAGYDLKLPGDTEPKRIGRVGANEWDWRDLKKRVDEAKKRLPELNVVGISVEDTIPYEEVARVMDICTGLGLKALSLAQDKSTEMSGAPKPPGGGG